jgi:hypothetical protein
MLEPAEANHKSHSVSSKYILNSLRKIIVTHRPTKFSLLRVTAKFIAVCMGRIGLCPEPDESSPSFHILLAAKLNIKSWTCLYAYISCLSI